MSNKTPRWKLGLIIALALGIGYLGGVATPFALWYFSVRSGFHMWNPTRITNVVSERLDLSEEQRVKVEQIVTQTRRNLMDLRGEARVNVRNMLQGAREETALLLTEEQKEKFDQLIEKRMRRYRRMRERFARMRER
jgi:Spy/CpxP family protein refolding chaperone